MELIALDTETTGSDFYHGARPFLVTTCDNKSENTFWEWPVNPLTRKPVIPTGDLEKVRKLILNPNHRLVLHNARFDCSAVNSIMTLPQEMHYWPWDRTECSLVASHVLGSALPHSLDKVALQYLRYKEMNAFEDRVGVATKKARDYCRRFLKTWRIAKEGLPDMPSYEQSSGKDKNGQDRDGWKPDMWLLKAILSYPKHPEEQQEQIEQFRKLWETESGDGLCADYANLDSAVTHRVWPVLERALHHRGLWHHYKNRMKLLPIAYRMERNGLTISETRLTELIDRYAKGVDDAKETCLRIAKGMGYPLTMPKGSANNDSLKKFFFGEATVSCSGCNKRIVANTREWARLQKNRSGTCRYCKQQTSAVVQEWPWLDLPVLKQTETGQPSMDKEVFDLLLGGTELRDDQRTFLTALKTVRGAGKAVEALAGYRSFWLPVPDTTRTNPRSGEVEQLWRLIHPNLNPTGTDTLRWSSKNPNLQNISKKKEYNLRLPFGPGPGREHWSFDYRNIELRIPTYGCGQQELIDLFERMNEPPFYGSEHVLNFSVVYPEVWEKAVKDHGVENAAEFIKSPEGYKDTYYQWIKNTDFALQYECGDAKADATAHRKGVKKMLRARFAKKAAYAEYWIRYANRHGYVETMPRFSVNPEKGYPLMTQRTERGNVRPTTPLAYHVSGTAMDLTAAAMIVCQEQLDVWNRECGIPDHYRMPLQVHDELFFDWPKAADPKKNPRRSNLGRARVIQRLMENCGKDIVCRRVATDRVVVDLPTPVSVEYHPENWSTGVAV